jgi:hypothetical protein
MFACIDVCNADHYFTGIFDGDLLSGYKGNGCTRSGISIEGWSCMLGFDFLIRV